MQPVIQEEMTGCGLASVAALAGRTYGEVRRIAGQMGISAQDERLYSDTMHVRTLLKHFGLCASVKEFPFTRWNELPDRALLAIKYHREGERNFWHWVVFSREGEREVVLDPAANLEQNVRTDFTAMQPKWYIEVTDAQR